MGQLNIHTFDVYLLVLPLSHLLRLEHHLPLGRLVVPESAQVGEQIGLERLRPIEQVAQVEVLHIVARDDVGVAVAHKVSPRRQHFGLLHVGKHLGANDGRAGVQREDVADEWVLVALEFMEIIMVYFELLRLMINKNCTIFSTVPRNGHF